MRVNSIDCVKDKVTKCYLTQETKLATQSRKGRLKQTKCETTKPKPKQNKKTDNREKKDLTS